MKSVNRRSRELLSWLREAWCPFVKRPSPTSRLDPSTPARTPALRTRGKRGSATIAVLVFLLLFAILLVSVSNFYLLPAISAAKTANVEEKRRLMAYSRLVLMVVLFILFVGLVMTFRVGRFFFPRATGPRVRTKYVDAWAEAGQRLETKDVHEEEEQ